ncbi:hypothetical protein PG995_000202 [Apiospora arundinis]
MEKLSTEIIEMIIDQLQQDSQLALYATISRKWQALVEARTFSSLDVDSDHLDPFRSACSSNPRRQATLRALHFNVVLPTSSEWEDHHANFRTAFHSLFSLMHEWEKDQASSTAFGSVELRTRVKVAARRADDDDDDDDAHSKSLDSTSSSHVEHLPSMRPDDIASLPTVRRFNHFRVDVILAAAIDPFTTCQLAIRLPRLESLRLEYWDPDHWDPAGRAAYQPPHRSARGDEPDNHGVEVQNFHDDQDVDAVCEAVRQLAEAGTLAELELDDILVSPDLFQDRRHSDSISPTSQAAAAAAAPWPAMRSFHVRSGIVAPGGAWYYTGDPGAVTPLSWDEEGIDEDSDSDNDGGGRRTPAHWWRNRPVPELFNPLVLAMAGAVLRMPRLRAGALTIRSEQGLLDYVALQCAAPGTPLQKDMGDGTRFLDMECRRWMAWIGENTEWEVPAEVRDSWKEFVGEAGKISVVYE